MLVEMDILTCIHDMFLQRLYIRYIYINYINNVCICDIDILVYSDSVNNM